MNANILWFHAVGKYIDFERAYYELRQGVL